MAKTLLVKLAGTVDNENLLKLGEMRFYIVPASSLPATQQFTPSGDTQKILLETSAPIQLEITGNGHFTDSTLTQNLGTTVMTAGNLSPETFYVSDSTSVLHIYNKYAVLRLELPGNHFAWSFDFGELQGITKLETIWLQSVQSRAVRSIDFLSKMPNLRLCIAFLLGDNSVKLKGNLSVLSNLTHMTSLNFSYQNVTGDISSFARMTNLTQLRVPGLRNVTGDTSSLAHLHPNNGGSLATFDYTNTSVTGTWPPSA